MAARPSGKDSCQHQPPEFTPSKGVGERPGRRAGDIGTAMVTEGKTKESMRILAQYHPPDVAALRFPPSKGEL